MPSKLFGNFGDFANRREHRRDVFVFLTPHNHYIYSGKVALEFYAEPVEPGPKRFTELTEIYSKFDSDSRT